MNGCWQRVSHNLSQVIEKGIIFTKKRPLSGGCISQSWQLTDQNNRSWFIKTNTSSSIDMFIAEAQGLNEIHHSSTIRVPKPYTYGASKEFSYLILEHLSLNHQIDMNITGKLLAKMHQMYNPVKDEKIFGWARDNTIGTTPQSNQPHETWDSFYKNERLMIQLEYAKNNGYSSKSYEDGLLLADNIHHFFTQYCPKPSLLHGDLWSGNCATDQNGEPVIFDPAVYYGDRETDMAMTELFGGFHSSFYTSYNNEYPLDQGYGVRKNLYNLYHILNHFNLFGGSYASQAEAVTQKLLSEIK